MYPQEKAHRKILIGMSFLVKLRWMHNMDEGEKCKLVIIS